MRGYITTEADLNFPIPNAAGMAAKVRTMFDGKNPVTTLAVAKAIGAYVGAVDSVLRRAERAGLVREILGKGWVPLET